MRDMLLLQDCLPRVLIDHLQYLGLEPFGEAGPDVGDHFGFGYAGLLDPHCFRLVKGIDKGMRIRLWG